uniref:Integrase catalytic domain-containing protein n=1 Tax=Cyprinus carpio TaxID=7962 RepID=A0A8C1PIS4_CYPCA
MVGKPNQTIPPAPLFPVPVVAEPFEHIIIDCVGPLPRSKSGCKYLLTIMCMTTRFPEVVPLCTITARTISKALVKFFTVFGLPKVVQSDQGTNFTSCMFSQVLKRLHIKHVFSSAYHPESQGTLERFHQTLKSMLRAYCFELERDWEEGIPWLLFASREVVQESLGFSPADLVFGHTPRGPLTVLKESRLSDQKCKSLPEYVTDFRTRLHRVCELAKQNLEKAQGKMNVWYDKKARERSFRPGDKVLVLLPVRGGSLQARYSGPYVVEKKLSDRDYVIHLPDCRKTSKVFHVNMIKIYHERESSIEKSLKCVPPSIKPAEVTASVGLAVHEPLYEEVGPSRCVVEGRLRNSEVLLTLSSQLSHLSAVQQTDILDLVKNLSGLFSDIPTQTSVIEHDIDVGFNTRPIKQHPYRVNPNKRSLLNKEVQYMLENQIAEPSISPWSSPC